MIYFSFCNEKSLRKQQWCNLNESGNQKAKNMACIRLSPLTSWGTDPGVTVGCRGPCVALWRPGRAGRHARVLPVLRGRLQAAFKVGVSAHRGRGSRSVRLKENNCKGRHRFSNINSSQMQLWMGNIQSTAHLLDVKVAHAVSPRYCFHFHRVLSDQLTEEFDWRSGSVSLPLDDSQLSEVRPSVTGQGFTVFKVKPAKLTRGIWHKGD